MEVVLKQSEFFRILKENTLTPNMYYQLYRIYAGEDTGTVHMELIPGEEPSDDDWIIPGAKGHLFLTHRSIELLKKVDKLFGKVKIKKVNTRVVDPEFENEVAKYRDLFPNIKLPSKSYARQSVKDLMKAFEWFFENYDYSWETIHKATSIYVDEYEAEDWMYFTKSQFFIRKNGRSLLSEHCDALEQGIEPEAPKTFNERVV